MRFDKTTVDAWRVMAGEWLSVHHKSIACTDIKTGRDAWSVAHRAGITAQAYADREVTDANIQTALERIFPNAIFKDAKRY